MIHSLACDHSLWDRQATDLLPYFRVLRYDVRGHGASEATSGDYTIAMLAFWLLEISTFIFILFAFEYIASGHMFPLGVLPSAVERILFLTPFPYQMYFPVSVYMGKVAGAELWQGLAVQFLWVVLMYALARFLWRRGIKKYSAFGG